MLLVVVRSSDLRPAASHIMVVDFQSFKCFGFYILNLWLMSGRPALRAHFWGRFCAFCFSTFFVACSSIALCVVVVIVIVGIGLLAPLSIVGGD
jgi:hypothetical protein